MEIKIKFFDKLDWSIYATLQTIIVLLILKLKIKNIINIKILVLSSLISMMEGKLLPKLIYTFFLCLLVHDKKEFINNTIITLLACLIINYINKDNPIYNLFFENKVMKNLLILAIGLWMIYIPYLLYK